MRLWDSYLIQYSVLDSLSAGTPTKATIRTSPPCGIIQSKPKKTSLRTTVLSWCPDDLIRNAPAERNKTIRIKCSAAVSYHCKKVIFSINHCKQPPLACLPAFSIFHRPACVFPGQHSANSTLFLTLPVPLAW